MNDPVVLAQLSGFGIFLWLSLYLLLRVQQRSPLILAGVFALFAQAVFFGSSVLTFGTTDLPLLVRLERSFWWCAVLPIAAWFHFSDQIVRRMRDGERADRQTWPPLVVAVYVIAIVISVVGSTTNLFLNYTEPTLGVGERAAFLERGPAYPLYLLYLGVAAAGALFNLLLGLRQISRKRDQAEQALARQLRLLVGGAVLFLLGALYIASRYNWNPPISVLPGYALLLTGLAAIGYGMAHFGLLLDGQNIQRDFVYSLTGIALVNLVYTVVLSLTGVASAPSLLALVALVTLTHTAIDAGRRALDKLFFNPAEQTARAEAREYATALGTDPVEAPVLLAESEALAAEPIADEPEPYFGNEKTFKNHVRKAITSLKNPPQLAQSPLLALDLVTQRLRDSGQSDNRLNRATALRELLIEQIDNLRPVTDESVKVGEAWRFYNVLHYPYVRELSRKGALAEARRLREARQRAGQREPGELEQVLAWLTDVDEDTFYKWQRRASDTIALLLWEENGKLRSGHPHPQPMQAEVARS
jgi:hypothetical protein